MSLACSRNNKNTSVWLEPNGVHGKKKRMGIKRKQGTGNVGPVKHGIV